MVLIFLACFYCTFTQPPANVADQILGLEDMARFVKYDAGPPFSS